MKSVILGIGVALTLAGCALDTPRDEDRPSPRARADVRLVPAPAWRIVVDPNVSDSRLAVVRDALDDWAEAVPCPFVYTIERAPVEPVPYDGAGNVPRPPPFMTMTIRSYATLPTQNGEPLMGMGDWYAKAGSRVALRDEIPEWDVRRVARHELGHAFRIPHLDTCDSLMSATCGTEQITQADVAAYVTAWCPDYATWSTAIAN